jgi:hypothetical protein
MTLAAPAGKFGCEVATGSAPSANGSDLTIATILAGCSLRRRTNGSYREYCKAEYVEADRQLWAEHVDFGLDRRKGRIAVVSSFQLDSIAPSRAAIRPAKDWMQSATLTLRTLKQIGPLLAAKLAVSHISPAILIGTSFHRS